MEFGKHPGNLAGGIEKEQCVIDEGDQGAEGNEAPDHERTARPESKGRSRRRKKNDDRHVERGKPGGPDRMIAQRRTLRREFRAVMFFKHQRLRRTRALQPLVENSREYRVGLPRLSHERQRDEREQGMHDEHEHDDGQHHRASPYEVDDSPGDRVAELLRVGRHARDDPTGGCFIVVRKTQLLQPAERLLAQGVAHTHLDEPRDHDEEPHVEALGEREQRVFQDERRDHRLGPFLAEPGDYDVHRVAGHLGEHSVDQRHGDHDHDKDSDERENLPVVFQYLFPNPRIEARGVFFFGEARCFGCFRHCKFLLVLRLDGALEFGEPAIEARPLRQFPVRPLCGYAPVFDHENHVRGGKRSKPVGDKYHPRASCFTLRSEGLPDPGVRLGIDRTEAVVEHKEGCFPDEGAGEGEPLLLSARQGHAALADHGFVSLGKTFGHLMERSLHRRVDKLRLAESVESHPDIVAHGFSEQESFLQNERDSRSEFAFRQITDIDAVQQNRSRSRLVQTQEQMHECRLSAARRPDDGKGAPPLHREADVLEHLRPVRIRKPYIAELDRKGRVSGHLV